MNYRTKVSIRVYDRRWDTVVKKEAIVNSIKPIAVGRLAYLLMSKLIRKSDEKNQKKTKTEDQTPDINNEVVSKERDEKEESNS